MGAHAIELRRYQKQACDALWQKIEQDGRGLVVAPTGAGKTYMMADIAQRQLSRSGRVLVMQHTVTLLEENRDRLSRLLRDADVRSIGGGSTSNNFGEAGVVVATIQSLHAERRATLPAFDLVIVDEAHRIASDGYQAMLADALEVNPNARIVGFTATPERSDGKGIARTFGEKPAAIITINELVKLGVLVSPVVWSIDYDHMPELQAYIQAHTWRDGNDPEASAKLNVEVVNEEIVRQHSLHAMDRQGIYFCADIEHAETLAAAFCRRGIDAVAVSERTPKQERRRILADLKAGRGARVVTNAFLLTEGFDAPPVSMIGLARSFQSKSMLIQAVGRGLRPSPETGKTDCLVLDFACALGPKGRHADLVAGVNIGDAIGRSNAAGDDDIGPRDPGDTYEVGENESILLPSDIDLAGTAEVDAEADEIKLPSIVMKKAPEVSTEKKKPKDIEIKPMTPDRIASLRKAMGRTQKQFAADIGLKLRAFTYWESGEKGRGPKGPNLIILHLIEHRPELLPTIKAIADKLAAETATAEEE